VVFSAGCSIIADNPRLSGDDLVAAVGRVLTVTKLDVSAIPAVFRPTFDVAQLFPPHSAAAAGLRLEKLVAARNRIRTVDAANLSTAAAVSTLRSLDLSGNEMTTLGDGLSLFRRLEHLRVDDNRLTRLTLWPGTTFRG